MANGKDFTLNNKYKTAQNKWFKAENLKFYLSDLSVSVAGKTIQLKEILLADFSKPSTLTYTFEDFDNVEITSVNLGIGVKPSLNNPSKLESYDLGLFADNNPLSSSAGMYWSMTSDYRFFVFEGKSDTSFSQMATDNLYRSFLFHIGKDKFFRSVAITNKSITLKQGEDNKIILVLNLDKMFSNEKDTIDLGVDNYTEAFTPQQEILAAKLSDNLQKSFSLE